MKKLSINLAGGEDVLNTYHIDWVILPAAEPAAAALKSKPYWRMVYEEKTTVIIRRKEIKVEISLFPPVEEGYTFDPWRFAPLTKPWT